MVLGSDTTKIQLNSRAWIEDEKVRFYGLSKDQTPAQVEKLPLIFFDVISSTFPAAVSDLSKLSRKIAEAPHSKVNVLSSFRRAAREDSLFPDSTSFMKRYLIDLKVMDGLGWDICVRRRLGNHDLAYYRRYRTPELTKFFRVQDISPHERSIDRSLEESLYSLLAGIDLIHVGDVTGLASIEALAFRKPVIMPRLTEIMRKRQLSGALKDMVVNKLIIEDPQQVRSIVTSSEDYVGRLSDISKKWYETRDLTVVLQTLVTSWSDV